MRTPEEFREQARKHDIDAWFFRECSICDDSIGFIFRPNLSEHQEEDEVRFDSNCSCVTRRSIPEPRNWHDVAEHYNMQRHPDVIKEYNEFWKFKTKE